MPNIVTALKAEIVRLSRKEIKATAEQMRKSSIAAKKSLVDLKRRVSELESQVKRIDSLRAQAPRQEADVSPAKERGWISGKGVRSLRQRLGLSQAAFAKLVGVTINGVSKWERKPGMLRLRTTTRKSLLAARDLTARTAMKKLAEMASGGKAGTPAAKRAKAK